MENIDSLKNKLKKIFFESEGVVDELSIAGDIQDDPTWKNADYDKNAVLKHQNKVMWFWFDFKRKNAGAHDTVGVYKTESEYIFVNESITYKDKIASIEYKKINAFLNGKSMTLEGDYKVAITPDYRGKGFSYKMYDEIIKNNTGNPGLWVSDIKLTPVNQKVWKNLVSKYSYEVLVSNGRTPALWVSVNDAKSVEKFRLQNIALKIRQNPDIIWGEDWNKERIRILLKAN